jgi:hypothetical protein
VVGKISSIEKSSELIGNRTRGLLAYITMSQPTTLPLVPSPLYRYMGIDILNMKLKFGRRFIALIIDEMYELIISRKKFENEENNP